MTIVDAIRTGKRFKRPTWGEWVEFKDAHSIIGGLFKDAKIGSTFYYAKEEDIIATDYIIEPEPAPKRKIYVDNVGYVIAWACEPNKQWKPLTREEFEELFE